MQRFLSMARVDSAWTALTWDVRGARKQVRVAAEEQGYS